MADLAETLPENEAPPDSQWCVPLETADDSSIRFLGLYTLNARPDITKGVTCDVPLQLLDKLEAALGPFQVIFRLMDLLATLVQCFLLMVKCLTNPFKIPKLLKCLPGLIQKLNGLLGLIPTLPQGIVAYIQLIRDIISVAAQIIGCAVKTLESLQNQLRALQNQLAAVNEIRDDSLRARMQAIAECGIANAQEQFRIQMGAMATIARVLCTIRAVLVLIAAVAPPAQKIADMLVIPDPRTFRFEALGEVTRTLGGLVAALNLALEAIDLAFSFAFGVPDSPFDCPIPAPEPEPEIPPTPEITAITDPVDPPTTVYYGIPVPMDIPGVDPPAPVDTPKVPIAIRGQRFQEPVQVAFGGDILDAADVQFVNPNTIIAQVSVELLQNRGITFAVSVLNTTEASAQLFAGVHENPNVHEDDPTIQVSPQVPVSISP